MSNNFQIGCNTTVQFFNGQIDNVKIYSRTLSASEINDSYSCTPVSSVGLNGSYNFNQGVAADNNAGVTTISDESGNNNNGTLSNFALNGSTSNWVNGKLCCLSPSNINLSNLVAYYTFENNSSADFSGNNHNATGSSITSTVNRFNQAINKKSF